MFIATYWSDSLALAVAATSCVEIFVEKKYPYVVEPPTIQVNEKKKHGHRYVLLLICPGDGDGADGEQEPSLFPPSDR